MPAVPPISARNADFLSGAEPRQRPVAPEIEQALAFDLASIEAALCGRFADETLTGLADDIRRRAMAMVAR
jgi:hypothetical protein